MAQELRMAPPEGEEVMRWFVVLFVPIMQALLKDHPPPGVGIGRLRRSIDKAMTNIEGTLKWTESVSLADPGRRANVHRDLYEQYVMVAACALELAFFHEDMGKAAEETARAQREAVETKIQ